MPRYHQKSCSAWAMLANSAGFIMPEVARLRVRGARAGEERAEFRLEPWSTRQRVSSIDGPLPREIEKHRACFFEDHLRRREIPFRDLGLDPHVDLPRGHQHRVRGSAQAAAPPDAR